jgi:regulator of protease activity HflC (stomatin/prohibitin superfamily)
MGTVPSTLQQAHTAERPARAANGYLALVGMLALWALAAFMAAVAHHLIGAVLGMVLSGLVGAGLYMQQPNEGRVLILFGRYIGTDREPGLRWANPFAAKQRISLRSRNLTSPTLKVNDKRGNPIEISAAVVWRVRDTAQALFDVDSYETYVQIQAEAALRHTANLYAYDDGEDLQPDETTLRAGQDEVATAMKAELQERFAAAGVEVLDAKLTHLAYAPEIAQAMLRRQQAEAVVAARAKIVHGAVSMVEAALKGLSERQIVQLDDERKAAMVSNLLVVLCSDKDTQPIVNTGTLYN